jgi:hypothetical protein
MWPFLFDTMYTIVRRLVKRENLLESHRSHLYQRLVIVGWSHQAVALLYGVLSALAGGAAWVAFTTANDAGGAMLLVVSAVVTLGALFLLAFVHVSEAKAVCRVSL